MKNIKLRLKGFIGIKKGLGLDEVSIDLSGVGGLVALAGPNGMGKTTILDNLHPFRTLPSRKRALIHQVFLRDSEKEYEFQYNGDRYRTLLKIDPQSQRSEGFIWVNGSEKSLTTGKVTEYDPIIQELFGSTELFFNSVFCAQNSKKISDMRKGELQNLFAEFLQLYRYSDWEKTSGTASTILMARSGAIDAEIGNLRRIIEEEDGVRAEIDLYESRKKTAQMDLASMKSGAHDYENEIKNLERAVVANDIVRENVKLKSIDLMKLKESIETIRKEGREESRDLRDRKKKIDVGILDCDLLLGNEELIRSAALKAETLESELELLRADKQLSLNDRDKKSDYLQTARTILSSFETNRIKEVSAADMVVINLNNDLKTSQRMAKGIDARDPACQSTTCSFIVESLTAAKEIPDLESKIEKAGSDLRNMEAELDLKHDKLTRERDDLQADYNAAKKRYDALLESVNETEKSLNTQKRLSKDLPKIEMAKAKRHDLSNLSMELANRITERDGYWLRKIQAGEAGLEELRTIIEADQKRIIDDVDEKLASVKVQLETLNNQITRTIETELPAIEANLQRFKTSLDEIEKAKVEYDIKLSEQKALVVESSEWLYLKTACGKDGLRQIELDGVLPTIAMDANDLLASTFGPEFTVKFKTQDEETLREIFEVWVIREDGSETLLDEISGGERVWILKAVRLALTLLSKEKSGKPFLTSYADEEDGALDTENAKNFIKMYRGYMKQGKFSDFAFISHKLEAISMADHVIRFRKGGIDID